MTAQDVVALSVCALAALWLVRRLFLSYGPPSRRPDVTTSALVSRTRARRAQRAGSAAPSDHPGCH